VEREVQMTDNHTWTPAQRPYVPYFSNPYTKWWMCVYREVSPTSDIRAEVFFFFFFLRLDGNAATRFHEDRITQCPKLSQQSTNDPCSLELSSGCHRGKRLWLPLLLERQDCERPKPEGCPPSGDQLDPKVTGSLHRENR